MKMILKRKKKKQHNLAQLKHGSRVEREHTDDATTARRIASDHLDEDPDYYKDWKDKEKILGMRRAPNVKKSECGKTKTSKRGIRKLKKAYGYIGPMSVADITLASWNEFFREGGSLNQPLHLQTNRLKKIERKYVGLARLHSAL